MSYSQLKLAAFTAGALAVCLSASAETPGLEHVGCCGAGAWAEAVNASPLADRADAMGSYIERSRAKDGGWRIHVAGMSSPPVALPPAVDRAIQHVLNGGDAPPAAAGAASARADYSDLISYDETVTRWSFRYLMGGDDGGGPWRPLRKCRKNDKDWCHRRTPPPVTGVPEPGAWVLLVVGVGAMGAALRWKRRNGASEPRSA